MKTTLEVADVLLKQAKAVAAREGTTVRALVEEGLRRVLEQREKSRKPFKLEDGSFKGGKGLQPGIREGDWEQLRALIYEGRGG